MSTFLNLNPTRNLPRKILQRIKSKKRMEKIKRITKVMKTRQTGLRRNKMKTRSKKILNKF